MATEEEKDIIRLQEQQKTLEDRGIKDVCRDEFVTKERHRISESLIFGFVGLVLTGFVIYLLSLVLKK